MLMPFHAFQNELYFAANEELWKTDGTSNGTRRVAAVDPGTPSSSADNREAFANVSTQLFFAGDGQGIELHRSDGTSNGTYQVRNIVGLNPSGSYEDSSFPYDLTELNGVLIFTAFDYDHGRELWRSDGTLNGTYLLKDILPGYPSSFLREITRLGDRLYFVANDGRHGHELWVTDGTADGTQLVEDLLPGPMSSQPTHLQVKDGVLYFLADAGGPDMSLRSLDPTNTALDAWFDTETSLTGATERALFAAPGGSLPNLYAYLLGLDPEDPAAAAELTAPITVSDPVTFAYDRRRDAAAYGLDVLFEVSSALAGPWGPAVVRELAGTALDTAFERVTLTLVDPATNEPIQFIRYRLAPP